MKQVPLFLLLSVSFAGVLALGGCTGKSQSPSQVEQPVRAVVEVRPLGSSGVKGLFELEPVEGGVRFRGLVAGLIPGSRHGFHVHEKGICSEPDGMAAGGHFKIGNEPHAGLYDMPSHTGDLGNIQADAAGIAHVDVVKGGAALGRGENNLIGHSLLIHKDPDDLKTQPTGASGPRIACGVIQVAK